MPLAPLLLVEGTEGLIVLGLAGGRGAGLGLAESGTVNKDERGWWCLLKCKADRSQSIIGGDGEDRSGVEKRRLFFVLFLVLT